MSIQIQIDGFEVIVDEGDEILLSSYKWHVGSFGDYNNYVYRFDSLQSKNIYLHREIIGAIKGDEVDHINLNGLDNRKSNLQIISHSNNIAKSKFYKNNSSGFRGVSRYRKGWKAQHCYARLKIGSNQLNSARDAALVWDAIVRQLRVNDFPVQNLPYERYDWSEEEAKRLIEMHVSR